MNFEKVPVTPRKRLLPEGEAEEVTKRKYEKMLGLLRGDFDEQNPKERHTVIDFQGLPPGSTEEDYFKWIEREVGIKAEILNGPQTPESAEEFKRLNEAFQRAKIFLQDTLKYGEKDIPASPSEILSKNDVVKFLEKTVFAKNKITVEGMKNCRLAKATVVAYETLKHDAELLEKSADIFENKMVGSGSKGTPLTLIPTEQGKKFYVTIQQKKNVKGFIDSRGKGVDSAMSKYFNRAESSAKTALKDGIGSTISIEEKNEAVDLLPVLCKWLRDEMKVPKIRIGNQSFLNESQMNKLRLSLTGYSENSLILKESKANPTSSGTYKTIKITGELGSEEFSGSPLAKQFEIQIVDPKDENEKGEGHHSNLDVVKLVVARTRLDGGCPEHIFKEFLKDASRESGMSAKTIEGYITKSREAGKPPRIIKTYRKNSKGVNVGRPLYIAHSVYSRWDKFDWIDNSLVEEIETKKAKATKTENLNEEVLDFHIKNPEGGNKT